MKRTIALISFLILFALAGFAHAKSKRPRAHKSARSGTRYVAKPVTPFFAPDSVSSDGLLNFAQSLMGIRYRASSSDPMRGFDCSGFVSYVFRSFNFIVPRSSDEFYNVGEKIDINDARPGDVILFTGTKSHHPHSIGHVGIIYALKDGVLSFIHSTSGKEHGVTISEFSDTYKRRFVQVIRLIKDKASI